VVFYGRVALYRRVTVWTFCSDPSSNFEEREIPVESEEDPESPCGGRNGELMAEMRNVSMWVIRD
jgi:hypothetical protein